MPTDPEILAATRALAAALRAKEAARERELKATGELAAAQAAVQRAALAVTESQAALHRLLAAAPIPTTVEPPVPPAPAPAEPPKPRRQR